MVCAAYGVDIQDAFDSIRNLGKIDEWCECKPPTLPL
jgi:hypothetical protein